MRLLKLIESIETGTEGMCPECCRVCADDPEFGHAPECELKVLKTDLENESWAEVYQKWIQS